MSALSIPAFHISDPTRARGSGEVFILSRQDASPGSGVFTVTFNVQFDPLVDLYPTGTLTIRANLNDGSKGTFVATTIDLVNSYGRATPTIYFTGRCNDDIQPDARGCFYWFMAVSNKAASQQGTPDIAGFAIHDNQGNRICYGTGPLRSGDIDIMPKP